MKPDWVFSFLVAVLVCVPVAAVLSISKDTEGTFQANCQAKGGIAKFGSTNANDLCLTHDGRVILGVSHWSEQ